MALLTLTDAHLAFGHVALLDGAGFSLDAGERLALIGRNGTGKSSLLRIVAGIDRPDDGLMQLTQGLRICYVAQEPQFDADASVFDAVSEGVAEAKALRAAYEAHAPGVDLDALQTRIEALGAWTWEQRVQTTLAQLHLDGARRIGELSGGTRKRVALAQALVALPDVLLLDEPTNHLDLDSIAWLEELLRGSKGPPRPPLNGARPPEGEQGGLGRPGASFLGAMMFVTHDRAFLDAVATRILELDRGRLRSYPGNFSTYERVKDEQLAADALAAARADKLLAQEEVWVRQGVEARRTRSVARIQRLEALRRQREQRRDALGQVRLEIDAGVPSGKIVAELDNVGMRFGDQFVVNHFSATLLRGDKVGLIGPNGCGKTTLLKLILGVLQPTSGTVRRGTKLAVAYFDQMRSALDLDATLAEAISPGSEWVEFGGARKHVMSYLGDFLFSPARANSPLRSLSGGERNRVLLARLFALPANVLVLDEPTNDLDIDTLELLEDLLQSYPGTVFLVSHDRRFLDNVVTSTIAWEAAPGRWREYVGGYEDWKLQQARSQTAPSGKTPAAAPAPRAAPAPAAAATSPRPRKLSYKDQRELDALPARIDALEAEQRALASQLAGSEIYQGGDATRLAEAQDRYAQIEDELMAALARWEALAGA